jgi:hypothetical protein
VDFERLDETRESLAATTTRLDRIERAFGRILWRFLWAMRLFLGGALVAMTKFCGVRDSLNGF